MAPLPPAAGILTSQWHLKSKHSKKVLSVNVHHKAATSETLHLLLGGL